LGFFLIPVAQKLSPILEYMQLFQAIKNMKEPHLKSKEKVFCVQLFVCADDAHFRVNVIQSFPRNRSRFFCAGF
jgi:hypothetical protein